MTLLILENTHQGKINGKYAKEEPSHLGEDPFMIRLEVLLRLNSSRKVAIVISRMPLASVQGPVAFCLVRRSLWALHCDMRPVTVVTVGTPAFSYPGGPGTLSSITEELSSPQRLWGPAAVVLPGTLLQGSCVFVQEHGNTSLGERCKETNQLPLPRGEMGSLCTLIFIHS